MVGLQTSFVCLSFVGIVSVSISSFTNPAIIIFFVFFLLKNYLAEVVSDYVLSVESTLFVSFEGQKLF